MELKKKIKKKAESEKFYFQDSFLIERKMEIRQLSGREDKQWSYVCYCKSFLHYHRHIRRMLWKQA